MAHRTTDALQRIDLLLAQAERMVEVSGAEEARARARQVIAYAELEIIREWSPGIREQLAQRMSLAEQLLNRLGGTSRDRRGNILVHPEDALVPDSWS